MRNGNFLVVSFCSTVASSSYRTYEEWKLPIWKWVCEKWDCSYRTYEEWKQYHIEEMGDPRLPFLPYLWGMETLIGRHWSVDDWVSVLTVPMRNGNCVIIQDLQQRRNCSYRTYEEWKLQRWLRLKRVMLRFLPYLWGMETVTIDEYSKNYS